VVWKRTTGVSGAPRYGRSAATTRSRSRIKEGVSGESLAGIFLCCRRGQASGRPALSSAAGVNHVGKLCAARCAPPRRIPPIGADFHRLRVTLLMTSPVIVHAPQPSWSSTRHKSTYGVRGRRFTLRHSRCQRTCRDSVVTSLLRCTVAGHRAGRGHRPDVANRDRGSGTASARRSLREAFHPNRRAAWMRRPLRD